MKIVVQKFGGTSVRDHDARMHAKHHVEKALEEGYKVVAVVSAMGRKGEPYATDTLLSLVGGSDTCLSRREQDLLLSTGEIISSLVFANMLNAHGISACALTGAQAGFHTNAEHTNAKITDMKCDRVLRELKLHDVVVVAGFQGAAKNGDVTTLGRGGSDTSAAALGAALQAEWIDIFTDVEGIMTADPRIAENARKLQVVTYNEVCNMAYQGAKVIHPRAVEIAMQSKVPIRIRSTYSDDIGTLVTSLSHRQKLGTDIKERIVTGIAHVPNVSQIKVYAKDGQYDLQTVVFKAMAAENISVDFINISPTSVVYTVSGEVANRAEAVLKKLGHEPVIERNCAKVSIVGAGIAGVPGITYKIVSALSEKGIRILQSADSHTTIWVLVKQEDLVTAVNALHDAFNLESETETYEIHA
ncbi:MAG: aspartate kinase [Weizmannia coagulans]|uniref:aspartate kinase n=1 Tax=Heyndrickxia TaxID=2837504 RepID=UPI00055530BC|nr:MULTISPECIES: aspartate kinase [Heyndrickxia]KGT39685.1 aspartate kinase [Heyndrickxia coagulans P38]MCI1575420.1 aspartate kinase [Heyndrickxia coagulans]MED4320993.1 aspartate kinase [Weizmannia sp. CD-2023]MED4839681.1 aspartate kinase [Weizmannia sp. CD-2023]MED4901996.1 aspartate kinase [Weizmannia sp. CD-2023]